ncbi:hypothetical protein GCM10027570_33860 [Streptomonospora sediminis]
MNAQTETPHAEIAEVWPRDGAVRIVGDLRGGAATGDGPWHLVIVLRETETRLQYDLPVTGGRFDVSVPLGDFVPAGSAAGTPDDGIKWDLYAAPADLLESGPDTWLRVGRHLDDIRGKKKIMVFPAQQAETGGARLDVRPFYTIKDNLSVECVPSPQSESPGKESR